MKRRELRECIFQLLFRVEFNGQEEMPKQLLMFVDDIKEDVDEEDLKDIALNNIVVEWLAEHCIQKAS